MIANSIRYSFVQPFKVSADEAYRWCTEYDPGDLGRMKEEGKREITWLSEDAVLLADTYVKSEGTVKKTKIVRLTPEERLWVSTHVAGPMRYSQFVYQITPDGRGASHIEFKGLHIQYTKEKMPRREVEALTRKILVDDSGAWKLLAKEMEKDLVSPRRPAKK